jgi:hypothetical protein
LNKKGNNKTKIKSFFEVIIFLILRLIPIKCINNKIN